MNRTLAFVSAIFLALGLSAQNLDLGKGFSKDKKSQEELALADQLFEEGSYLFALDHYRPLEQQYGESAYLKYKIGVCLLYKSDEIDQALDYLLKVKEKNAKAADIDFYLARAYHLNERYDEALASLALYEKNKKATPSNKQLAPRYATYCTNAKELVQVPIDVKISNLGTPLNSEASEYVPVITSDESTMLFTYVGPESRGGLQRLPGEPDPAGSYYEDIYFTQKRSGQWLRPIALDTTINSIGHDACIAISNDGQTLIVFKNSEEDLGDIYFSKLDGERWSTPVRIEGEVNTPAWEGSASLTADEEIMYFASEREGGYGGRDIYTARRMPDGRWGDVKNLGDIINTPYDDDAPFIHPNGVTLIFSSQGHKSMGGYDIFRTDLDINNMWSTPVNIGYPINTPGDDKYFVLSTDGKRGYYSSGKAGGLGQQDLYLAEVNIDLKEANVIMVSGAIFYDEQPAQAKIYLRSDGKILDAYATQSNASTGKFLVNLSVGKVYDMIFELNGQREMRTLDAMRTTLGMLNENFDIRFYSDGFKAAKAARENFLRDSTRRADSLALAAVNPKRNNLAQTETVTTTSTTTMLGGMSADDYNSTLSKYGTVRLEGLEFTVQVAAYRNAGNFRYSHLESVGSVNKQELGDGVTRFVIGKFYTLNDAEKIRQMIHAKGNNDAFVTAMYQGRRMLLKDLSAQNFFQK